MDYQALYNQLVVRANSQERNKKRGYYEVHHIIPKCMGGSDDKSNLVLLTAREHFICHRVLCEIYPDVPSIHYAFWMMCNMKSSNQDRSYRVSSREYDRAKLKYAELLSERVSGDNNPNKKPENRLKISKALTGRVGTWRDRKNPEHSERMTGRLRPDQSSRMLGENNPNYGKHEGVFFGGKVSKVVEQYSTDGVLLKEYKSLNEASRESGVKTQTLSAACRGLQKTSGGYIWKFKN